MSASEISSLLNERRNLVAQIRALDPADQQAFDALTAQVADIDGRVTALEESMASAVAGAPAGRAATGPTTKRSVSPMQMPGYADARGWNQPSDSDLLRSWLRCSSPWENDTDRDILLKRGFNPYSKALEFRTGAVGTGSLGGYTANSELLPQISRKLKATSPLLNLARVINTDSGVNLLIPTSDDTSNAGRFLSENAEGSATDIAFGQVSLGAYKATSDLVKVSRELLMDSGVDLAQFIGEELGLRIGRGINPKLTTGSGSGECQGIVTGATSVSAGSATAIAYADLVNLVNGVDQAWMDTGGNHAFMCHQSVFAYLRRLLDGQNRPLIGDVQNGAKPMLLGYPLYINNGMDSTLSSGKFSLIFGDFSQFVIRQAGGITVYRSDERFFEFDMSAFVGYLRIDSKLLQATAIVKLAH